MRYIALAVKISVTAGAVAKEDAGRALVEERPE